MRFIDICSVLFYFKFSNKIYLSDKSLFLTNFQLLLFLTFNNLLFFYKNIKSYKLAATSLYSMQICCSILLLHVIMWLPIFFLWQIISDRRKNHRFPWTVTTTSWTIWATGADPRNKHRNLGSWQGHFTTLSGNLRENWISVAVT